MIRGIAWGPTDYTGGPVDEVFAALRSLFEDVQIARLMVTHAADDNNVWFITRSSKNVELQIDSMPDGTPPFLLESEDERGYAEDANDAIEKLSEWLRL